MNNVFDDFLDDAFSPSTSVLSDGVILSASGHRGWGQLIPQCYSFTLIGFTQEGVGESLDKNLSVYPPRSLFPAFIYNSLKHGVSF